MKQRNASRTKTRRQSRKPSAKRVKEIQTVFEKLGIGDEASRRNLRPTYGPAPEQALHYRIVLTGSTQI